MKLQQALRLQHSLMLGRSHIQRKTYSALREIPVPFTLEELLRILEKQPWFPPNLLLQSNMSSGPIRIPLASPRDQM